VSLRDVKGARHLLEKHGYLVRIVATVRDEHGHTRHHFWYRVQLRWNEESETQVAPVPGKNLSSP
jgi:hypothetical protein